MRDGIPLPASLSGITSGRLILIDKSLVYLVAGALVELSDDWRFEQTGTFTVDDAHEALATMLDVFLNGGEAVLQPIGSMLMFAGAALPDGWLLCDGSEVSRVDYAALFAEIGTDWGIGDGTITFNLPNLIDRLPMGAGGSVLTGVGSTAGALTHTLITNEIPAHNHGVTDPGHIHTVTDPGHVHGERIGTSPAYQGATGNTHAQYQSALTGSNTQMLTDSNTTGISVQSHVTGISTNNAGSGNPHSILNPVAGVSFIIFSGVY